MRGRSGAWLEDLTWPEARQRFEANAVVAIPVVAAAGAHGVHLPLRTDTVVARALGQKLTERLPVVVAPVVGGSLHSAIGSVAGIQHPEADTVTALIHQLLRNLRDQGVRRLAILDTGLSTERPIDAVADRDDVLILHMHRVCAAIEATLAGSGADERETSVMLALEPRNVRIDRLGQSSASAFKGERLLAALLDDIADGFIRRWPDLR